MKTFLKNYRVVCGNIKESGQMLLFVLIVVLLLLIIVLAVVVNVRVDIKETQMEREYEKGYSIAEEELFKISSDGYDAWRDDCDDCEDISPGSPYYHLCSRSDCASPDTDFRCTLKHTTDVDGVRTDVMIKECMLHEIRGISINQDETLEVLLDDGTEVASGVIDIGWEVAPAMSVMLVCKDASNNYSNVRASVCLGNTPTCGYEGIEGFISIGDAQIGVVHDTPLNVDSCGGTPVLLRLRAIGGEAINISVTGDLPSQMAEERSQSFTGGVDEAEGLSAPEVVTLAMLHKRLPALFDYVLFVASGDVSK